MQSRRSAILLETKSRSDVTINSQYQSCLHYCNTKGYQISRQHLYYLEDLSLGSSDPQMVQLRFLAVLNQLDVIVIAQSGLLGPIPLWRSLKTAKSIHDFYTYNVRIESASRRHNTHDIYQQMYIDAIQVVKQLDIQQIGRYYPHQKYNRDEEQ